MTLTIRAWISRTGHCGERRSAEAGEYKLAQFQALPRVRQNTRHICVEGWDVIGRFGGARLSDFLQMVGADPTAKFITVSCADDITSRWICDRAASADPALL